MEGLNLLVNALYGIKLQTVDMMPGEAWTQDVYKLEGSDTSVFSYYFILFKCKCKVLFILQLPMKVKEFWGISIVTFTKEQESPIKIVILP